MVRTKTSSLDESSSVRIQDSHPYRSTDIHETLKILILNCVGNFCEISISRSLSKALHARPILAILVMDKYD